MERPLLLKGFDVRIPTLVQRMEMDRAGDDRAIGEAWAISSRRIMPPE